MMVLFYYTIAKRKKTFGKQMRRRKGFTLIEILVVLAILSIIGGIGYISLSKNIKAERLLAVGRGFANEVQNAKNKSLIEGQRFGVEVISSVTYNVISYDTLGIKSVIKTERLPHGTFGTVSGITVCPDGSPADLSDGVSFPSNEIMFAPIGIPLSSGCAIIKLSHMAVGILLTPGGEIQTYIFKTGNWIRK